jgi:aspartyl/asparaginyl beta-hydroxylase (cupin superfamily)
MNVDAIIRDVRNRFGHEGLERAEECLRVLAGKSAPEYMHPEQEATRLFFPEIAARPWHEPASFPWAGRVEAQWEAVRSEFERLQEQNVTFYPYEDQYTRDVGWPGWNTWHLYRGGVITEAARQHCPRTVKCLETSPHGLREGLYSVLKPGARLPPHTGGVNLVLTVHLPLIVPDDCALRVGGETRAWEEGKLFIFDDSFIHEAWNGSDAQRVVLLWDVWHPDFTDKEIAALTYLFPRLETFLNAY